MRREAPLAWTETRHWAESSEEVPAAGQATHISGSAFSSKQPSVVQEHQSSTEEELDSGCIPGRG